MNHDVCVMNDDDDDDDDDDHHHHRVQFVRKLGPEWKTSQENRGRW